MLCQREGCGGRHVAAGALGHIIHQHRHGTGVGDGPVVRDDALLAWPVVIRTDTQQRCYTRPVHLPDVIDDILSIITAGTIYHRKAFGIMLQNEF